MNCVPREIILFPVGFVVIPVNPVSIEPVNPPTVVTALPLDSKSRTFDIVDTPT